MLIEIDLFSKKNQSVYLPTEQTLGITVLNSYLLPSRCVMAMYDFNMYPNVIGKVIEIVTYATGG